MSKHFISPSRRRRRRALPALLLSAGGAALAGGWYLLPAASPPAADTGSAAALTQSAPARPDGHAAPASAEQPAVPVPVKALQAEPRDLPAPASVSAAAPLSEPQALTPVAADDDDGDGDSSSGATAGIRHETARTQVHPNRLPAGVLNYYSDGYTPAGRERIQSALQTGTDDVLHITNAGDEIRVSRNRAEEPVPPGSTDRDGTATQAADATAASSLQDPELPHMATANCPGTLPETTSEEAVQSMLQNYGCRYLLTCRLSNDGNDQVLCAYTFAGVRS